MRKIATAALLLLLLGSGASAWSADANPRVRLSTSLGDIVVELDSAKAPNTVKNFLGYAQEGFYNGTVFHRIIDSFMIQGGGFDQALTQKKPHTPIRNEANNGLKNKRGTIAMARTGDPHSATSQFFINVVDNSSLDHSAETMRGWGYTVFGQVVEGMDVVDKIRKVPTGPAGPFASDVPREPVVIRSATVE